MRRIRHFFKFLSFLPVLGILFFTGCSNEQSREEAGKLLDKQVKILEEEQESIEKISEKLDVTLDSLKFQEKLLLNNKAIVESQMEKLNNDRADLAQTLKEEEIEDLDMEKTSLEQRLSVLNDSLSDVTGLMEKIALQRDTINVKEQQLSEQRQVAKSNLVTGIEEIDRRLDDIERQRMVKQQELELNKQKVELANKKIELLESEKSLYLREKNDLLAKDADNTEIDKVDLKIDEVTGYISDEQNKIRNAQKMMVSIENWLADVSAIEKELTGMMELKYDENTTIESFTRSEIDRLNRESEDLQQSLESLNAIKNDLAAKRKKIDQNLASVENEISVVKDKDLVEILREQAVLETEEADLSAREAMIIDQGSQSLESVEPVISGEEALETLKAEINAKRSNIEQLRSEIAREQQSLSEKQAEIDQNRASSAKALGITTVVIIGVGLLVILAFYIVGYRRRKTNV